ncbi:hypothetical protein NHX12_004988 [Muraenolepis orangiensis]|uniref:Transmembrane protein 200C n=1 Tax=Muraenolepis orangiensis TaxID=630683 RepID=A0A9Q0DYU0_9TELE|nr:hypothetical protein NHX12_004988 [Muraenolepis orangiensis]
MIATGGLLRMNRRQDSLRSKNRAENKRKQKAKNKARKKNDVVVVKGKLNLCSPAGVVAAVGVAVLVVGISMAILGYWPSPNHQEYQERRRTGLHRAHRTGYSRTPAASSEEATPTDAPAAGGPPQLYDRAGSLNDSLGNASAPEPSHSCGVLCDFLDSYLYSDNLKVFGPLVMGVGIFLFICANAVLHENRDKKTKIINLRDIYSTVIDLHSVRSKEYSPLNGLVNYTQSRSAEAGSAAGPSGLYGPSPTGVGGEGGGGAGGTSRSSWPSVGAGGLVEPGSDEVLRRGPSPTGRTRSWSRDVQTFTDTVYSIYRDHGNGSEQSLRPQPWETTSIVASSVNAFTPPVIRLNSGEAEESAQRAAAEGRSDGAAYEAGADAKETDPASTDAVACRQGTPKWTPTGSRLSLNSLPEQQPRPARRCSLSVSACRQGDRGGRRFSCPRLERSNSRGYIKLTPLEGESFEAADADTSWLTLDPDVVVAVEEVGGARMEDEAAGPRSSGAS